jgi:hypothetical protein
VSGGGRRRQARRWRRRAYPGTTAMAFGQRVSVQGSFYTHARDDKEMPPRAANQRATAGDTAADRWAPRVSRF